MNQSVVIVYEEFEDTKGESESVYRRRTDNTMAKRKRAKGQRTIYKTHTKDRVTRTPLKPGGEPRCSGRVGSMTLIFIDFIFNVISLSLDLLEYFSKHGEG
jgi:hypothetical protein